MLLRIGRIVMLGTALLLTLPPGWCCAAPSRSAAKPAEPMACCCHQAGLTHKTPDSPSPPPAPIRECCRQEAVAPAAFKMPIDFAVAILVNDAAHLALLCPEARSFIDGDTAFASPPLQILLCVWRC